MVVRLDGNYGKHGKNRRSSVAGVWRGQESGHSVKFFFAGS